MIAYRGFSGWNDGQVSEMNQSRRQSSESIDYNDSEIRTVLAHTPGSLTHDCRGPWIDMIIIDLKMAHMANQTWRALMGHLHVQQVDVRLKCMQENQQLCVCVWSRDNYSWLIARALGTPKGAWPVAVPNHHHPPGFKLGWPTTSTTTVTW